MFVFNDILTSPLLTSKNLPSICRIAMNAVAIKHVIKLDLLKLHIKPNDFLVLFHYYNSPTCISILQKQSHVNNASYELLCYNHSLYEGCF